MHYKFERFPSVSVLGNSFRVALKEITFSNLVGSYDVLQQPLITSLWDIKVKLVANLYPVWNERRRLHPLFQFLLDNQLSLPRNSTYLSLPDPMEVLIDPGELITQYAKLTTFEIDAHVVAYPPSIELDYEGHEDFWVGTSTKQGVFTIECVARHFYVPEDL